MSKSKLQLYFTDRNGNALNQATVTIKVADTQTNASTWTDRAGTISGDNPILTDADGEISVYVTPGRYDITATKSGATQTIDDHLIIDESSAFESIQNVKSFGATGDGATDDTAAIDLWLTALCTSGGDGYVPSGTYLMGSGVTASLSASVRIGASADANFVADEGFTTGNRMFLISTGTGSNHVFEWVGGQFDATEQPNSGAGESNDIFSFNAENCARCKIVLDRTTAGADWLNSGSDSHLFIGGARNIHAEIGHSLGATDSGIYISSSLDGSTGNSLYATGNFEKCNVGIIVKRLFETWTIEANVTDCITGVGGGSADNDVGAIIAPGDGCMIRVNALRTERPCVLQAVAGGRVDVNAVHLGVSITGYTSALAKGLYLSGASRITGVVNAYSVNPSCTKGTAFRAVDCDRRTLDASNFDATDNLLIINCDDVGKAFAEDANCARNYFIVKENNVTTASTLTGTNSSMHRANPSSSGFEMDEPVLSLAGIRGAEALRVLKTASQVNYVQITGSIASAASGVAVQSQGSDTNVPMTISTKGTGAMFLGGNAAAETLRISKVASQVNAVEVTASAAGNPVTVAARGSDTDVNLDLNGKGTGNARSISAMTILRSTAIPAGGTAGSGYKFSSTSNFGVFFGSGAPSLAAAKGSLYLRSDGSTTNDRAYINTDGSTTWTALTTAA